jgi:hypothetical protein
MIHLKFATKRCLYGLKQSPRKLNILMRNMLIDSGWQKCISDQCTFTFRTWTVFAMIALYVDDIPPVCKDAT